jgi:hypothetical protein
MIFLKYQLLTYLHICFIIILLRILIVVNKQNYQTGNVPSNYVDFGIKKREY